MLMAFVSTEKYLAGTAFTRCRAVREHEDFFFDSALLLCVSIDDFTMDKAGRLRGGLATGGISLSVGSFSPRMPGHFRPGTSSSSGRTEMTISGIGNARVYRRS